MKSIDQWLTEYGESHRHHKNKAIHYICVPVIYLSLIGLLSAIPSYSLYKLLPASLNEFAHFGTLLLPFVMLYYLRLSVRLAIGMMVFSGVCLWVINLIGVSGITPWKGSAVLFILAWTGQFIGHKIEGEKPSFFKDLSFLLIGPLWILAFLYRKWGLKY